MGITFDFRLQSNINPIHYILTTTAIVKLMMNLVTSKQTKTTSKMFGRNTFWQISKTKLGLSEVCYKNISYITYTLVTNFCSSGLLNNNYPTLSTFNL